LPKGISTSSHRLAVAVLDRYGNEFAPRVLGQNLVDAVPAQLTYPDNYSHIRIPALFRWKAVEKADCYVWQLAADPSFTDIVCTRETTATQFNTSSQLNIKDDGRTYYWRVRTRKANALDVWSETRQVILSPNGGSDVNEFPGTSANLTASVHNNQLTIETATAGPAVVRIYKLSGQLVSTWKIYLQSGKNSIPLDRSGEGASLIHIQTGAEKITIKGYDF
jgi:hypothetical protein